MYRRYYDGYAHAKPDSDTGEIIVPKSPTEDTYDNESKISTADDTQMIEISSKRNGILGMHLEIDDLILIGILLFLLSDSDDNDPILLIVIGYLLLSEIL